MTVQETGRVMDALEAAYPRYYAGIDKRRQEQAIIMWASAFVRDDVRLVVAAVQSFIEMDEKGFPPVPGQIKAKMRLIAGRDEMTEAEAWNLVFKALGNSFGNAREAFEKLPPLVQRIVGSPAQLRQWAGMDAATVNSVVASNFQRSYREAASREREYAALPPDVRELVGRIAAGMEMSALESGGKGRL